VTAIKPLSIGFCLAAVVAKASAQDVPLPLIEFVGGQMRYELQAPRNGTVFALRVASPLIPLGERNWLLEPSVGYGWYRAVGGQLHHFAESEMQIQLHPDIDRLQPYVGLGGGFALTRADSTVAIHLTGSASVGLRFGATDNWGLAGELRLRALDLFRGTTREMTVSVFRRLE
jgi:hypothetical protein